MRKLQADQEYGQTCEKIAAENIGILKRTNLLTAQSLAVVKSQVKQAYNEKDAEKICHIMDNLFNAPSLF